MISVILPTYRNPEYLDLCLKSILENQVHQNQIIVIVDGYIEESQEVLEKHEGIDVIDLEENMGMQHAINMGVWNSIHENIFVINDDNVFPTAWDKRLYPIAENNTVWTVNQVEPTGPGMFNFPVIDNLGMVVEDFDYEAWLHMEKKLSSDDVTSDGSIFPFYMNKRWFMTVGGFDTWYDSPNLCDWDFFHKLQLIPQLDFKRTHGLHLYHFGSIATKTGPEAERFRERERFAAQQYEYKWGYPPHNGVDNWKIPENEQY